MPGPGYSSPTNSIAHTQECDATSSSSTHMGQEVLGNQHYQEQLSASQPEECALSPSEEVPLTTLLEMIQENLDLQQRARLKAVEEVEQDAEEAASPKLDTLLLQAAVHVALSAATEGIAQAATARLSGSLARDAQGIVSEAIKESLLTTAEGAVASRVATAPSDKAALRGFFRAQWDALSLSEHDAVTAFISKGKVGFRLVSSGYEEAQELYQQQEQMAQDSKAIQYKHTLQQWLLYLAKVDSGTDEEGHTDMEAMLGDTSRKGVLGLRLHGSDPGKPVSIVDAEMDGVGDDLAARIAAVPIGQLEIPINLQGTFCLHGIYSGLRQSLPTEAAVDFGVNEQGVFTLGDLSLPAMVWLAESAGYASWDYTFKDGSVDETLLKDTGRRELERIVEEEINTKRSLNEMGVSIQTEGGIVD